MPSSAFGVSAPQVQVTLEPTLARVLVYGEPQLPTGATRGSAPADYLVNGIARYTAPLRPLGLCARGKESRVMALLLRTAIPRAVSMSSGGLRCRRGSLSTSLTTLPR